MHLLIAREAVDQHLQVAGDILEGDGDLSTKAKAPSAAGKFYAKWLPEPDRRRGPQARLLRGVRRRSRPTCASPSATRASSRARRSTRWAAGRPSSSRARRSSAGSSTSAPSCSRSRRPPSTPNTIKTRAPGARRAGLRARRPVLRAGPLARRPALRRALVQRRRRQLRRRAGRARRPLHVGRGGHRGPVGRRADDRLPARLGRRPRQRFLKFRHGRGLPRGRGCVAPAAARL